MQNSGVMSTTRPLISSVTPQSRPRICNSSGSHSLRPSPCNNRIPSCSEEGKGLFTMGVVSLVFGTLDMYSKQSAEIYARAKAMVDSLDPKTAPPGLLEQYEIQLKRFKPGNGTPSCEFICAPGLMAYPSEPVWRAGTAEAEVNTTIRQTHQSRGRDTSR